MAFKIQKAINTVNCGLHDFAVTLLDGLVLRSESGGEGSAIQLLV